MVRTHDVGTMDRGRATGASASALPAQPSAQAGHSGVAVAEQDEPEAAAQKEAIRLKISALDSTIEALGALSDPEIVAIRQKRVAEPQALRDQLKTMKPLKT